MSDFLDVLELWSPTPGPYVQLSAASAPPLYTARIDLPALPALTSYLWGQHSVCVYTRLLARWQNYTRQKQRRKAPEWQPSSLELTADEFISWWSTEWSKWLCDAWPALNHLIFWCQKQVMVKNKRCNRTEFHLNSWLLLSRSMTWWPAMSLFYGFGLRNCGSTHSSFHRRNNWILLLTFQVQYWIIVKSLTQTLSGNETLPAAAGKNNKKNFFT